MKMLLENERKVFDQRISRKIPLAIALFFLVGSILLLFDIIKGSEDLSNIVGVLLGFAFFWFFWLFSRANIVVTINKENDVVSIFDNQNKIVQALISSDFQENSITTDRIRIKKYLICDIPLRYRFSILMPAADYLTINKVFLKRVRK